MQSNTGYGYGINNDEAIDIDVEGSGRGGKEVFHDLESSGSGSGPGSDDEDTDEPLDTGEYDSLGRKVLSVNNASVVPKKAEVVPPTTTHRVDEPFVIKTQTDHDTNKEVFIMNPKSEDRPTSFFAQPEILAGWLVRIKNCQSEI